MFDLDKIGSFYLGRHHDLASRTTDPAAPLVYDSRDLTTHAVCVGMTGSGKTGLCLSLLEEAALDGIPSIAIDPKGDLGNLLLAFPKLEAADFRPWIDESEAARKQMSPDEFAASQAATWRNGLADWGEGPERIQKFCDAVERVIYTPGSSAGIPITVLKSFHAPPPAIVADGDAFREQIASTASGLLALLGIDADPVRSREHIFLSNLFEAAWRGGQDLDLPQLIQQILRPPFTKVGVVDVEAFYSASDRTQLSMQLNNLLASPSFANWMEGAPLDVQSLLFSDQGKPRLSILSIAHLDEAQRMFFVTILLNEVLTWVRSQPGTNSLRAILYMDEVFGYFPPIGNPPSKLPMLTLLKQARAYGLGCVLATQNPVDLDYKGLSNAGTWFLGRLQTERDKARVMEGLEGASAAAGSSFNRREMEAKLAALGNRVFLMNNVHNDAPDVFQTRWAMSYLRGPLTRDQIKALMDPVRARFADRTGADGAVAAPQATNGTSSSEPPAPAAARNNRPIVPAGIREEFVAINERVPDGFALEYRPSLYGKGKVHFRKASENIDVWRECYVVQTIHETPPDDVWDGAYVYLQPLVTEEKFDLMASFAEIPSELARERSYTVFKRQLGEHLYRTEALKLLRCEPLNQISNPDETEEAFRARIGPSAAAHFQSERDEIEKAFAVRLTRAEAAIEKNRARVSTQRWQLAARISGFAWVVVDTILRVLGRGLGGRARSPEVALRYAATERGQQANAQIALDKSLNEKLRIEQEHTERLASLEQRLKPENLKLEPFEIRPLKSDIDVDRVVLAWLPWRVDSAGRAEPVY